jgi:membrane-associated phospholipid phosphatase
VAVLAVRALSGRVAAAVSVAVFVIPLVVGLALVRLGWHYPTDVVGGVAVGVGVACGTYVALTRGIRKIRTN